jgi:hypothetical protein
LPEWAGVYLEEAPRLLRLSAELDVGLETDKDSERNVPNMIEEYSKLLRKALEKETPTVLADAVLQPLAHETSPAVEELLMIAMTPEAVQAAAEVEHLAVIYTRT